MSDDKRTGLFGQALRAANAQLSKLRKLGLYAGKEARGQPTKYALGLLTKFKDAITGTAAVVSIPKGERREIKDKYAGQFEYKRGKLVVPKNPLNDERVRLNPKTKTITKTGVGEGGTKYRKEITPIEQAEEKPPRKKPTRKQAPVQSYQVIIPGRYKSPYFDRYEDLLNFIMQYDLGSPKADAEKRLKSWRPYIESVEIDW